MAAPRHSKEGYTTVGRLLKPFRIHGEVKVQCMSFDFFRYQSLQTVLLFDSQNNQEIEVEIDKAYDRGGFWYFHFAGIDSPEEVGQYRQWEILIPDEDRPPLPEGKFYFSDLRGLKIIDLNSGREVGILKDVQEGTAHAILIADIAGQQVLIPWVDACVGETSLESQTIEVDLDYLRGVYEDLP